MVAVGDLVRFTLHHFVSKPWFIRMLNTENLDGSRTIRAMADARRRSSRGLIAQIGDVLERGAKSGVFRGRHRPGGVLHHRRLALLLPDGRNKHTLRAVFPRCGRINADWLEWKAEDTAELLLRVFSHRGGLGENKGDIQ